VDDVVLAARLALAAVMAVAAAGKLADLPGSRQAVEAFGVPGRLASPVGVAIPLVELGLAGLLVPVATAPWAAAGVACLLAVFAAAIARSLVHGAVHDCHCFGALGSRPVGRVTLVRTLVLAALAVFTAVAGWERSAGVSATAWVGDLSGLAFVVAGLCVLGAANAFFLWQLFRQNGRLLARVGAVEAGAVSRRRGPAAGEPAPAFALSDLDGLAVDLDGVLARGHGALLVFTDPGCGHCEPLLPAIADAQRGTVAAPPVVLISRGEVERNRARADEHGLVQVLVQQDMEVADLYGVVGFPAAVLVGPTGRVAGELASGHEAVAGLLDLVAPPASTLGGFAAELLALSVAEGAR
jgi:methylamine dehydrogenase accessory protein MauD